jgi:hypothetical protein
VTDAKPRRAGAFVWTANAALVALASSLVALVFDLRPDLRGDPRTLLGASVSVFAVDPGVSYGQYLADASISDNELRRSRAIACKGKQHCAGLMAAPGLRIYVTTNVQGFKSRGITMRLSLYDAATMRRVEGESNVTVATEQLDSPSDRHVIPVWVACPGDATRRYFARFELYHNGDGILLAVGDSPKFRPRC